MSNTRRAHISSSSLRTSIAALAVVVVSGIVAIPAAHAQTFTVLYTFTGGSDGSLPTTGLVKDAAGNLYGTTFRNGDPSCNVLFGSCGVVFKLDPSGSFTVLHSFVGKADGAGPRDLIGDASGALSGVTDNGGVRDCPAGCGVIFKVESGGTFIPLYSFTGFPDGRTPKSLTSGSAGNLYGITQLGGAFGSGSVFEFDSSGHESILYSFRGGANGSAPRGPLARDAAGNLYGTTTEGGDLSCGGGSGCGTAYKLTPTGEKTIIRSFNGGGDGS